jgi:hypothetical protein
VTELTIAELERLVELKQQGLITDDEFAALKARLLARLTRTTRDPRHDAPSSPRQDDVRRASGAARYCGRQESRWW